MKFRRSWGIWAWVLRGRPWCFYSFLRGLDSLILASRCLRVLIQTSSKQLQLDKELRGCLLCSSHLQGLLHIHLYSWTLELMIQITCPEFKRKCLLLKLSFALQISYFCTFFVSVNITFFPGQNSLSGTTLTILMLCFWENLLQHNFWVWMCVCVYTHTLGLIGKYPLWK